MNELHSYKHYALAYYQDNPRRGLSLVDLMTEGIWSLRNEIGAMIVDANENIEELALQAFDYAKTPMDQYIRFMILLYGVDHYKFDTHRHFVDAIQVIRKTIARRAGACGPSTWHGQPETLEGVMTCTAHRLTLMAKESMVTDCVPLVPYVGTCGTSFSGVYPITDLRQNVDAMKNLGTIEAMCQKMVEIISDPHQCMHIIDWIDKISPMQWATPTQMKDFVIGGVFEKLPSFCGTFALLAYACRQCVENHPAEIGDIAKLLRVDEILQSDVFGQNPPTVERLKATEADLSSYTNRILENAQDLMTGRLKTETPKKKIEVDPEAFDLGKLRNFIKEVRQFRTNYYTNQAFANFENVASISYVDDFILIQPKSPDGTSDYCYVPLIDDLAGSRVVVARIGRGSPDVDIFTEAQFREILDNLKPEPIASATAEEHPDGTTHESPYDEDLNIPIEGE